MKHSGRARQAAVKLILLSLAAVVALFVAGIIARFLGNFIAFISTAVLALWAVFVLFTLYFFRDPTARPPAARGVVVSPGHGKVDIIDEVTEASFMGGRCKRVSIFLSVLNVHVQNAPVAGVIAYYQYTTGQFLSALKLESAEHNENLLFGFVSEDPPGVNVGVRLIAGVLARRIVPFAKLGERVGRGERISLIQFGSRTDVYLPLSSKVKVSLGDRVVGGESILAELV